jgi:hypothetical protein
MEDKSVMKLAAILVIVAAVAMAAAFAGINNAAVAKSNKAFGKCVSSAKGNQTAKLACNSLKRGHPFSAHVKGNETD